MKKAFRCARQIYCVALFATLLFFPCACIKQSVQEVHVQADITTNNSAQGQQASEVSGMQPDDDASKKRMRRYLLSQWKSCPVNQNCKVGAY